MSEGTTQPPAGEPRVEPAPPEADDLAQVVLRDLAAGVLASLGACGAALASLAAFRPEDLVGRPGSGLAFALGAGLGAGAAFAAAELADGLVARRLTERRLPRALAAGLALGLLSPLAPLGGAFELLLVQGGSSVEAAKLVVTALDQLRPAELPGYVGLSLALGLPLLATRRLGWGLLSQAAATTGVAAGLFVVCLLLGPWGLTLPVATLASLLLGGAVAAPVALALADRLVRRARGRRAGPRARRRRLAPGVVLGALALALASLTALPGIRASRLRLWLLTTITTDPAGLASLYEASTRLHAHEGSTPATAGKPRTVTRGTPLGPPALSGLDLDAVGRALDVWLPAEGERAQRAILERAAAAEVPEAMTSLGEVLIEDGRADEARPVLFRAAWAGHLPATEVLRRLSLSEQELTELDACYLARVREGDPTWVRDAATPWSLGMADRPGLRALSGILVARAELGDVQALLPLEVEWRCHHRRPELEACLGRWAAGGARAGDPALTSWRAAEVLARLATSEEATPAVVKAALAAARRHAAVETARALAGPAPERWLAPARHVARRVLLELLVAHPGLRQREDEGRLPLEPVPVGRLVFEQEQDRWGQRVTPQALPSMLAAVAGALAATPPLPSGAGGGADALLATADPARRPEALERALAALARDPRDADAHRTLARLDLVRALDGRTCDIGPWRRVDEAALSRAEAHLLAALSLDPASAGACLERALVIAAREDSGDATRAAEVHAWLALGHRLGPPGCAAPVKAALRRYLRETEVHARGLGEPIEVAALQRHVVERWKLDAHGGPASAARLLEAVERASRRP